ncbi:MOSC domain-containing protein [bacterium]|nr:MOSC domain-containing protein [bacterium]
MPILKPTDYHGRITFLGRMIGKYDLLHAEPCQTLTATFAGIAGEAHEGLTAPSCSRMTAQYPEGTTIANTRQISILSVEELAEIAARMGLESLSPTLLGATIVVEGIPDFSHVPPGSRLQASSGATLVVNLNNRPCTIPSRAIEAAHPGFGKAFKPAANGRRGVVAWVEAEGPLTLGDSLRLHIPDQRVWRHLAEARKA